MPRLPPLLFPPLEWYAAASAAQGVRLSTDMPWQRQSLHSRCWLVDPHGLPMALSIPVVHARGPQALSQVQLQRAYPLRSHWRKSLQSLYGLSPYYRYYRDELDSLLGGEYSLLLELQLAGTRWLGQKLGFGAQAFIDESRDEQAGEQPQLRPGKCRLLLPGEAQNLEPIQPSALHWLFTLGPEARSLMQQLAQDMPAT